MLKVPHPIVMFVVVALVAIGIGLGVLTAPVPARSLRGRFRPLGPFLGPFSPERS
jgi:hypothetical protein